MALRVFVKSTNSRGEANVIDLYVPFSSLPTLENEEIDHIEANGDELREITDQFSICLKDTSTTDGIGPIESDTDVQLTIPFNARSLVFKWYGDIAKTIYFNLREEWESKSRELHV